MVPIHSSAGCQKIVPAGWTPATMAAEAAVPQRVPRGIHALAILESFLTQKVIILAYTGMCCLLLPKNRGYMRAIQFLTERLCGINKPLSKTLSKD